MPNTLQNAKIMGYVNESVSGYNQLSVKSVVTEVWQWIDCLLTMTERLMLAFLL